MNRELEEEMGDLTDNYMSIKRSDWNELVEKLHAAEKRIIMQSKSDIPSLVGLKPSRIILEFDHVEHK